MNNLSGKLGFIIMFLSLFSSAGLSQTTETITINTYYPTPYGQYRVFRLFPGGTPTCQEGVMYFDSATSSFKLCTDTGAIDVLAPVGGIAFFGCSLPLPAGWEWFNTPADRFVVGQGSRYAAPTTTATVPTQHKHIVGSYSQVDHSHSVSLINVPETTNIVSVERHNGSCSNGALIPDPSPPVWNPFHMWYIFPCDSTDAASATHTHTILATSTNSDGGENIVGESDTVSHVPLYYSTCLIRKRTP